MCTASGVAADSRELASTTRIANDRDSKAPLNPPPSHLHVLFHFRLTAGRSSRSRGSDGLHVQHHTNLAGLLEFQSDGHLVALLQWFLQVHHHQMIAARRELD